MSEKEYIVCLNKGVDYDQFWHEMENTTSGLATIPDRAVDIVNNRDLSERSCHYALTDEEAAILQNDPRVTCAVVPVDPQTRGHLASQTSLFNRYAASPGSNQLVNWGLRRCILNDIEIPQGTTYDYCLDGTGIDIVINDNGVMRGHPEFDDEMGVTRLQEIDWYAAAGVGGTMPAGHYGDVGDHGTHVAGIAAGKTYGWAKNARIYSCRYDLFTAPSSMDLIKGWHNNKPIDPATGKKRPTIVNQSWGYRWYYNNSGSGVMTERTYRGVTTTSSVTDPLKGMVGTTHNFTYTPDDVDQQELTDAGVICVRAAGNYSHKIEETSGVDWNNNYHFSTSWGLGAVAPGSPIYYHRKGSPYSDGTILVANGNVNGYTGKETLNDTSERGPGVHIVAPGTYITSSTNTNGFPGYNARYLNSNPVLITTTTATGGAAGQKVITTASTAGVVAGQSIVGYGIPVPSFVQSFVANTSITITQNLTAPASGTLYFYNSYYIARISGTSMAAPQVTGVLALFLQLYPDATPADCKKWLANFGSKSNIMFTTTLDNDYTNGKSLMGQANKYLYSPFNQDVVFKQSGGSA